MANPVLGPLPPRLVADGLAVGDNKPPTVLLRAAITAPRYWIADGEAADEDARVEVVWICLFCFISIIDALGEGVAD